MTALRPLAAWGMALTLVAMPVTAHPYDPPGPRRHHHCTIRPGLVRDCDLRRLPKSQWAPLIDYAHSSGDVQWDHDTIPGSLLWRIKSGDYQHDPTT